MDPSASSSPSASPSSLPSQFPSSQPSMSPSRFVSNCLLAGQALYEGQYLESSSGHRAVFDSNGRVCIYDKANYGVAVWCIDRIPQVPGYLINRDSDGNIVAYNSSDVAYWDTDTLTTAANPFDPLFGYLVIQNDRNLVYYKSSGAMASYSCDSEAGLDNGNFCQTVPCTENDCSDACVRAPMVRPTCSLHSIIMTAHTISLPSPHRRVAAIHTLDMDFASMPEVLRLRPMHRLAVVSRPMSAA